MGDETGEDIPPADRLTCLRCGSHHLMQSVGVTTNLHGDSLRAKTWRAGFLHLPISINGDITARICADCGHTELVTDNLAEMWKVYSQENR